MLRGLPGNPTSSLPGGLASSLCCLALDSSSSFPCPAFLAITKSTTTTAPEKLTKKIKSGMHRLPWKGQIDEISMSKLRNSYQHSS
ncbi:hypothetical protein STEG23_038230 [Scotinomys teguina]